MAAVDIKNKIMGEVTGMLGVLLLNLGKQVGLFEVLKGGKHMTTGTFDILAFICPNI